MSSHNPNMLSRSPDTGLDGVERTKVEGLVVEIVSTMQNDTSNPIEKDLEKGLAQDVSLAEAKLAPNADEAVDPYLVSALTLSIYHVSAPPIFSYPLHKPTHIRSNQVTWDGSDDPNNPFNWPQWKKWAVTILTSLGGMVTLMSSTMTAPALTTISQNLHTDDATTQLTLSIFVLSFAFGPMLLAPMTEIFGRKPVWILSCCFDILWNTVFGFSNTKRVLIASRFFPGLGGSVQFVVRAPQQTDDAYGEV